MQLPDLATARTLLIEAGARFDRRGWVPATSGNFSARLADGRIAMTASGCHKGRLGTEDIIALDEAGRAPGGGRARSAEAGLHIQLYRLFPEIGAVLHIHSPGGVALGRAFPSATEWTFEDHELLKAFPGTTTHATRITIPIVANDQDIGRLGAAISPALLSRPRPPAYLIRGHGLYGWGRDIAEADRVIEATEWLIAAEREAAMWKAGAAR